MSYVPPLLAALVAAALAALVVAALALVLGALLLGDAALLVLGALVFFDDEQADIVSAITVNAIPPTMRVRWRIGVLPLGFHGWGNFGEGSPRVA